MLDSGSKSRYNEHLSVLNLNFECDSTGFNEQSRTEHIRWTTNKKSSTFAKISVYFVWTPELKVKRITIYFIRISSKPLILPSQFAVISWSYYLVDVDPLGLSSVLLLVLFVVFIAIRVSSPPSLRKPFRPTKSYQNMEK